MSDVTNSGLIKLLFRLLYHLEIVIIVVGILGIDSSQNSGT